MPYNYRAEQTAEPFFDVISVMDSIDGHNPVGHSITANNMTDKEFTGVCYKIQSLYLPVARS